MLGLKEPIGNALVICLQVRTFAKINCLFVAWSGGGCSVSRRSLRDSAFRNGRFYGARLCFASAANLSCSFRNILALDDYHPPRGR